MTWLRNHYSQYFCYYDGNRIPHLGWVSADFVHCFDHGFLQAQEVWGGFVEVRGEKNTRTVKCLHIFFWGGGGAIKFWRGSPPPPQIGNPGNPIDSRHNLGLEIQTKSLKQERGGGCNRTKASTPPAWDTFVYCIQLCPINRGTCTVHIFKGKAKHGITNKASNEGSHIWGQMYSIGNIIQVMGMHRFTNRKNTLAVHV